MAKPTVMIIGGGLAGMAAAIKLAELDIDVSIMSLLPLKRSHSCCAQGGINSVNDLTRQLGDNEWKHFEDTVYGGDFLQHQPPVRELAAWAPRIIDLMDRLGVTFNRTNEGFRDQRRFGGTLYRRTAFAGATTGQQLLYALDEQVRRWEVAGKVRKFEHWDFLGPILDDRGRCRGCVGQDLVTMQIRAFPADAADRGHRRVRHDLRPVDQLRGVQRKRGQPPLSGRRRVRQSRVRTGPPDGRPRGRQAAADQRERPRRGRAHLGPAQAARSPPAAGNPRNGPLLLPRRTLSEIRQSRPARHRHPRDLQRLHRRGLERAGRSHVRLSRRQRSFPARCWTASSSGILEIYEKFQGVDPRTTPMKIFPAVHYSMGGLWCDYEPGGDGGLKLGSPRNQQTNVPGAVRHRRVRLPVPRRQPPGGQLAGRLHLQRADRGAGRGRSFAQIAGGMAAEQPASLFDRAAYRHQADYRRCWPGRPADRIPIGSTPNWAG